MFLYIYSHACDIAYKNHKIQYIVHYLRIVSSWLVGFLSRLTYDLTYRTSAYIIKTMDDSLWRSHLCQSV